MSGGRPTKYTAELIDKARHYVDNFSEYGDLIPSIASLSIEIGVSRETCHEWARHADKKEFSDIVKGLLASQERALLNGGLGGSMNPSISKVILTKHGYRDGVDLSSSDGSMSPKSYSPEQYAEAQMAMAKKGLD